MPRKTESSALARKVRALVAAKQYSWAYALKVARAHWQARDREDAKRMKARRSERDNSDALGRLEKWLLASTQLHPRWLRAIDPPVRRGRWTVELMIDCNPVVRKGKTLVDAIHAALDAAEAKR